MVKVGGSGRTRSAARIAAAVLGSLALGSIAVPLLQQSITQASATRLHDGTLAAPNLGTVSDPPADGSRSDTAPVAVAAGVAARADGSAVRLSTFASTAPAEADVVFPGDVLGMALSPDGALLAVVDDEGSLSLLDVTIPSAPPEVAAEMDVGKTAEVEVATSGDGSFVAAAATGGELLQLYDVAGGVVRGVRLGVPIADLSPGPGSTVYALADGAIVRLDASGARVARAVASPAADASGIALVAGGTSLALWDAERLLLLDESSLDAVSSYQPGGPVLDVADGATAGTLLVAAGGDAPHVALIDLASGTTLSEIADDIAAPAAVGAAGPPASFVLATPRGAELGTWDATRVPWPAWWASTAILALLAGACLLVAQRAGRTAEPAMVAAPTGGSMRLDEEDDADDDAEIDFAYLEQWAEELDERPAITADAARPAARAEERVPASATDRADPAPVVEEVAEPAYAGAEAARRAPTLEVLDEPPSRELRDAAPLPVLLDEPTTAAPELERPVATGTRHPVAVSGSIHDRMAALSFAVTTPAPAERVVDLVRIEAGSSDATRDAVTVDGVFNGRTVSGSVLTHGVRTATFIVSLGPAPDGGTRTRFDVNWYRTTPPMVPFFPVDREESVSYGPLRDFAMRLADRLERIER